jgi:hypothetical protein
MREKQKKYQVKEITCSATGCNAKFDVVISSIETLVTQNTLEVKSAVTTDLKEITHYIVVTCPLDKTHTQRVYIDSN